MGTVFDTLAYAKKLKAIGVPDEVAEVQAAWLAEIVEERLTTKRDLKESEERSNIQAVGSNPYALSLVPYATFNVQEIPF